MQVEIEKLNGGDLEKFSDLLRVFEYTFEMKKFVLPEREHLLKLLARPDFIVFVAAVVSQIVGGLTAYVLEQYYSERPLAYIFDLAVKQGFQRQGIGRELVRNVVDYCRERGFEEVFVQADKVDDYAIDFYRKTGITDEEQVVHFYYRLM